MQNDLGVDIVAWVLISSNDWSYLGLHYEYFDNCSKHILSTCDACIWVKILSLA